MAAAPDDEENELNFSDIDSDDENNDSGTQNGGSVVAHKDMSRFNTGEPEQTSSKQEFEAISPVGSPVAGENDDKAGGGDAKFEPISPIDTNFEAISPPASPSKETAQEKDTQFENISDDENDKEQDELPEGKFSPQVSDNELNFNDESSNDSGYQIVKPTTKSDVVETTDGQVSQEGKKDEVDEDDIEAPMPSPFSDLGDPDDIPGADGDIIDDILKNSSTNEESFGPPADEASKPEEINEVDKEEVSQDITESLTTGTASNTMEQAEVSAEVTEKSEDIIKDKDTKEDSVKEIEEVAKDNKAEEKTGDVAVFDENEEKNEEGDDENAGDLIANIFGDSDEEEADFEGFVDEDEELPVEKTAQFVGEKKLKKKREVEEEESSDEEVPVERSKNDFDIMLAKRKEINRLKRRNKRREDSDMINDNDDIIIAMINKMKGAAEEDRLLNQRGKAATKKIKMLPDVVGHLRKSDLLTTFIDCGILNAMKEWLTPLPDHALPHVNIRKTFLKMLIEFPPLDKGALKTSGIGRAVMLLFKHPKETVLNRRVAGKIVSNWARPIFNVSTNFQDMSREEREDRDKANIPEAKRRRLSSGAESNRQKLDSDMDNQPRKPGDKGWIGRARVPMPSHRDYVNRPVSKVDSFDASRVVTKEISRYEKQVRKLKEKKQLGGTSRKAVNISLNGSKMAL